MLEICLKLGCINEKKNILKIYRLIWDEMKNLILSKRFKLSGLNKDQGYKINERSPLEKHKPVL
jgi:hypothetical protein